MVPLYWYTNTFLFCLCLWLPRRLRPCLLVLHIRRCREIWGSSSSPVLGHFTAKVTIRSSWSGKEKRGPMVCPEGQEVGERWGLSWLKCFLSRALQHCRNSGEPLLSGQDPRKCSGPATWMPEEPTMPWPGPGVVGGHQLRRGWLDRANLLHPPLAACGRTKVALAYTTEGAGSLPPPKRTPGPEELSSARGWQVISRGHS